jgi:predicted ribosomally synthesized peptide with nif11-like leader
VIQATGAGSGGDGAAGEVAVGGIGGFAADGADADGAAADALAAEYGLEEDALDGPLPLALEAFLRQAEVDPDLQEALSTAADAAAVAEIARGAGFNVGEADLWGASDETPHALQAPPPATQLADPWGVEESPAEKA